ncbi:hypothetical protein EDC19_1355 [Natranaerovirga hydrolytica]|uniref:SbsA Ig-like domain-containing protein n=1 Tax=Natranaerovirga hydrolytica TaxID=680378 RepID=A0A4R1MKS7_9FIRM|nr:hypothetical protein [Natranaerovirga hydrolytica]TCK93167.1 hypothetical protein EDC19_1355 [Natranaerovirga hydrolytica]
MKKSVQKLMAFALASIMILTSITTINVSASPVSDIDKIATILDLEVIVGEGNGVELEQDLTRYRAFTMLNRLIGRQDDLDNHEIDENSEFFADADEVASSPFILNLMAYLKANPELGVVGYGDNTLRPLEEISSKEYTRVLLEALGYRADVDYTWDTVADLAYEIGLIDSLDALNDDNVNVANVAVLTYNALTLIPNNTDDITLGESLGYEYFAQEDELVLEIASVNASNLKQVEVIFNMAIEDNEDAADASNYALEDADILNVSVTNDVVTINLEEAAEQQSNTVLTISNILEEDVEVEVNFFDTSIPTVEEAKVVGSNTVKLFFSEPMNPYQENGDLLPQSTLRRAFELNNGLFFIQSVEFMNNYTEANVTFYLNLPEGDNEITVKNDLVDFAGYSLISRTLAFEVVIDESAPEVVEVKEATPRKVVLVFDKDLKNDFDAEDFFHTNTSNKALSVEQGDKANEVVITFEEGAELPNGVGYIFVSPEAVEDLWGNVNHRQMVITVQVTVDEEPPVVKEVKVVGTTQQVLEIVFDEDIKEVEKDHYLFFENSEELDEKFEAEFKDGKKDTVVITFDNKLKGDYVLIIEDVEDVYGNAMDAQTFEFSVEDKTRPNPEDFVVNRYEDDDLITIVVNFGESMATQGHYSILNVDNYFFGNDINDTSNPLADFENVTITTLENHSIAMIEVQLEDDETLDAFTHLIMTRVDDISGNRVLYNNGLTAYVLVSDDNTISGSAKATATDVIIVELEDKVVDFDVYDFEFYVGDEKQGDDFLKLASIDNSGSKSIITFTLNNELDYQGLLDGESVSVKTIDNASTKNYFGDVVSFDVVVADEIAPELNEDEDVTVEYNGTDYVITLTMTEAVKTISSQELAAVDFDVVFDGDKLLAGMDFTVVADNELIIITIADVDELDSNSKIRVSTKDNVQYASDLEGNTLEQFDIDVTVE